MSDKYTFRFFKRSVRFWWQRRTRGWDDSETWSLDCSLAKLILPRLIKYKELSNGYPYGESEESWNNKIDEMIWTFDVLAHRFDSDFDEEHADWIRIKKGLKLFSDNCLDMWW
jgi:hypothetical protein